MRIKWQLSVKNSLVKLVQKGAGGGWEAFQASAVIPSMGSRLAPRFNYLISTDGTMWAHNMERQYSVAEKRVEINSQIET